MSTKMTVDGFTTDAVAKGGAVGLDLMIGGTPTHGLVIGGGLLMNIVTRPTFESEGRSSTTSSTTLGGGLLGPFIDWFPDPHGGFHFGGLFGFATLTAKNELTNESASSKGGGGAVFLGYDAWVSDDWSLGGVLRLGGMATQSSNTVITEKDSTGTITVLFTGLYH